MNIRKRFKSWEECDVKIDETLATNNTDLICNGMNEDEYLDLIKDEYNARLEIKLFQSCKNNLYGVLYLLMLQLMIEKCKTYN